MDSVPIITVIASLFLVIGAAEPLAARLPLPHSGILAAPGILIGAGGLFFLRTDLTDAMNPVAEAIPRLLEEARLADFLLVGSSPSRPSPRAG